MTLDVPVDVSNSPKAAMTLELRCPKGKPGVAEGQIGFYTAASR